MPINKEKLEARRQASQSRPKFIRPESWRYDRIKPNWRKPKGIDNHQRKQKSRGRPGLVKIGYGTPKIAKGLHPSGYTDNLVHNINDLENLNPKQDGIRFGHSVGAKKRNELIKVILERKFKVFNARVSQNAS
jgi:large subunit ribosomal protein L32e